jgi:hypothetical protein
MDEDDARLATSGNPVAYIEVLNLNVLILKGIVFHDVYHTFSQLECESNGTSP